MGRVAQSEPAWRPRTLLRVFAEVSVLLIAVGAVAQWRSSDLSAKTKTTATTHPLGSGTTKSTRQQTTSNSATSQTPPSRPDPPLGEWQAQALNPAHTDWELTTRDVTAYLAVMKPSIGCSDAVKAALSNGRAVFTNDPSLEADSSDPHLIVAKGQNGGEELNRRNACGGPSQGPPATMKPLWIVKGDPAYSNQQIVLTLTRSIHVTVSTTQRCLIPGGWIYLNDATTIQIDTYQGDIAATPLPATDITCPPPTTK